MATPLKVDGQSAIFEITLRSSEGDFLNLVKNDAELVEVKTVVKDVPPVSEQGPAMLPDTGSGTVAGVDTAAKNTAESPSDNLSDKIKPIPVYYYKYLN
jgi:hypothetical protein